METSSASTRLEKDFVGIARSIGPAINHSVEVDEKNRRLSPEVMNTIKQSGLYKMLLPRSLGGFETDPITTAKVVEELALHNTAAGWSLMVVNCSHWWGRNLSEQGIDEIYETGSDTFVAGAVHPPMQAMAADGGFIINGRTPLASNIHEAEWIFASAMVFENGQPKMNNGMPQVLGICFQSGEFEIADTWQTIGMKATDSNDIVATNAFIPSHRCFALVPGIEPSRYYSGPLYRFATIGIVATTLIAPVALAVAANAIKELKAMAAKKTPMGSMVSIRERGSVQRKLGIAEANVQASRAYLHQTLRAAWEKTLTGEMITLDDKAGLLLAGAHTIQSCLQSVDLMYSAAGSTAIYERSKLSHYFTDAQVIRQHGFGNESRYETAAQIYLGLQPDLPVVIF